MRSLHRQTTLPPVGIPVDRPSHEKDPLLRTTGVCVPSAGSPPFNPRRCSAHPQICTTFAGSYRRTTSLVLPPACTRIRSTGRRASSFRNRLKKAV